MGRFLFLSTSFCTCIFFLTIYPCFGEGLHYLIVLKNESKVTVQNQNLNSTPLNANYLRRRIFRSDTLPDYSIQLYSKLDKEAQFHGGNKAWAKFVSQILTRHVDEFNESDYGTCIIRFAVDTKGTTCHAEAATMRGSNLAKVIIEAIKRSPKWIPAEVDGQPVNSYRILPVTLTNPRFQ